MDVSVLEKAIESNIGRIVTFVVYPILLPVVGALAFWLQKNIGIHLDPVEATGFIVTTVGGLALLGFQWLKNRGLFEHAAVVAVQEINAAQAASAAAGQTVPTGDPVVLTHSV